LHKDRITYQDDEKKIYELKFQDNKKLIEARLEEVNKKEAKFIADIDKKNVEISDQDTIMNKESGGERGNSRGIGDVYRAAKDLRDQKTSERDFLRAKYDEAKPGIEEEKKLLKAEQDKLKLDKEINYEVFEKNSKMLDGLIKRITIAERDYPVPSHILSLLLIIIEVSPIIFKMMLQDGPYDRLVENQRRLSEARYAIELHQTIDPETSKVIMGHTNHQADTLSSYEIGNLKVQRELTEHIQKIYLKNTLADIDKNPDKYIERDEDARNSG